MGIRGVLKKVLGHQDWVEDWSKPENSSLTFVILKVWTNSNSFLNVCVPSTLIVAIVTLKPTREPMVPGPFLTVFLAKVDVVAIFEHGDELRLL